MGNLSRSENEARGELMFPKWSNLVSAVSMAAFLVANMPGLQASFEGMLGAKQACPCAAATESQVHTIRSLHEETGPSCKHCRAKKKSPGAGGFRQKNSKNAARCPCPSCPCQHQDKSCPCPGGCAFCSVAKVPCHTVPSPCTHLAPA